jgi:nicotinamidase-related amidase
MLDPQARQSQGERMSSPAPVLDPKRTALLVMDFQQGVLQRMPGLEPLLGRVRRAIADVRDHGGTIGYVRVAFTEEDWAAVPAANPIFARAAQDRTMHHEDPATAIHDSLAPQPGDIVVRKTRVGAMSTTDLDRQLRDRGTDTLVLAGISTSGVVLATVVEAADRDYRLYVLADGTEDPDEQTRDVLLGKVFPRRARVIDTATLHTLLSP